MGKDRRSVSQQTVSVVQVPARHASAVGPSPRVVAACLCLAVCALPVATSAAPAAEAVLAAGLPAAMPAGLTMGVGAGVLGRGLLAWGARASWSTATEFTEAWAVTHDETRLRAMVALQRSIGRGSVGLRLAPGLTVLRERAERAQSARLTTSGLPLSDAAWALLPAVDLELAIVLRVVGDAGVVVRAGPTLHVVNGAAEFGWTGGLGVAWLP
jgi:hypothetical protein